MNLSEIDEVMEIQTQRDGVIAQLRDDLIRIQPRLPETWPTGALFQADLGLDSLDLVELVARAEQRYGILIDDTDIQSSFPSMRSQTTSMHGSQHERHSHRAD